MKRLIFHACANGKSTTGAGIGVGGGRQGRKAARGKGTETANYSLVEDTEERADGDALVHKAGLLQVLGQTHSHQL